MRESFVLHSEYIEDLPEEYKERFLQMTYDYGIHETVPVLKGLEKALWIKIQRRIDSDREQYETRKQKLKEYKENWKKNNKNDSVNSESSGIIRNHSESFGIIPTNTHSVSDTVSVSDIVNDIVSVSVSDNVYDSVSDIDANKNIPSTLSTQQENYAKQLFSIFKDAGLPCAKGNELSFMQTDFKNSLAYIHKSEELKNFNSSDIIQACKNYVTVYKNEHCYLKSKWNLFTLVKSKIFYSLMPGNFELENFYSFQSKQSKTEEEPAEKKVFSPNPCPKCKGHKVWWSQKKGAYVCDDCSGTFNFDEYLGEL